MAVVKVCLYVNHKLTSDNNPLKDSKKLCNHSSIVNDLHILVPDGCREIREVLQHISYVLVTNLGEQNWFICDSCMEMCIKLLEIKKRIDLCGR